MKSVSLRTLLREPIKIKRLTRAGNSVEVTDKGKPLWIIQPADKDVEDDERAAAIDEVLNDLLKSPPSKMSLTKIVLESRR